VTVREWLRNRRRYSKSMAITRADFIVWHQLKSAGLVQPGGKLLEIGQSNVYGDVPFDTLLAGLKEPERFNLNCSFGMAEAFYSIVLDPSETFSIDYHGTDRAVKLDLNLPHPQLCDKSFSVIINGGTTEHVFNQYQAFKTIHDACKVGGIMYHGVPWRGWLDHGFYCYQPTFFYDLARANGYRFLVFCGYELGKKELMPFKDMEHIHALEKAGKLAREMMLYVVMKKERADEFRVPMQGVYDDSEPIAGTLKADWHTMRSG